MNRGEFHDLLGRVEDRYRGRPAALERAVDRWARLGLAVILAWLAALAALASALLVVGVVAEAPSNLVALGFAAGVALYLASQAGLLLLVEPNRSDGPALRPGQAPALRAMLDALRRDLGCRSFDLVRLSPGLNASVIEVGRPWLLGRPRVILELGLPTLLALPPAEFRAVLAHEFVHLSARHGRASLRLHRLERRWATLSGQLQKSEAGSLGRLARGAAARFVGWYWPRLRARSLVLSRQHEFHADRVAASVAGPDALASALWRLECRGAWLAERFWPEQERAALDAPEPPDDIMARLGAALRAGLDPEDRARWARNARGRPTHRDETHPSFADRARALGLAEADLDALEAAGEPAESAAALLGDDLDGLIQAESRRWRDRERAAWRDRHRRGKLGPRPRPAPDSPDRPEPAEAEAGVDVAALWLRASGDAELRGVEAAVPQFRAILDRAPGHPGASVVLGQHLLTAEPAEGERLLWGVAEAADERWTPSACRVLEQHYRNTGQPEARLKARARLDRHEADVESARAERAAITAGDAFLPHDLSAADLDRLRAVLAAPGDCAGAWLARKAVRFFPDRPVFVLAVRSPPRRWGRADADRDAALVRALAPRVELAGQVLVVARSGPFRRLARRVEATPGSRVVPIEAAPAAGPPGNASDVPWSIGTRP